MSKKQHERITKSFPVFVVDTDEAQGIVEAIVNVFGIIDLGTDIIHPGAFTKTINENWQHIQVLDNHNTDSVMRIVGKLLDIKEIGRSQLPPEMLLQFPEATGGLWTKTQYLLNTPEGFGVFQRIAAKALKEYSIALDPHDVDYGRVKTTDGKEIAVRNVRTAKLWEYSPVIWGMNQATITTDVKSNEDVTPATEETKTTPEPDTHEEKQATLGTRLEANLRLSAAFCITDWLGCGMIDAETVGMLNTAVESSMSALRSAIPMSVADMPLMEMWSADGGETKAGRMISGTNREKIQAAIDVLQALMDASAVSDTPAEDAQSKIGSKSDETVLALVEPKATPMTGTDVLSTSPSIIDAAVIERELSEIQLMMEMVA